MSATRSGWVSATIATYVANEETQVISALSPPISRSLGGFVCVTPEGSATSRSAMAILSGRSSRISTNSRAHILLTSFAGMGAMLFATLNGSEAPLVDASVSSIGETRGDVIDDTIFVVIAVPLDTIEDGMMGRFRRDKGRVAGGLMVEEFATAVPGRMKWSKVSADILGEKGID